MNSNKWRTKRKTMKLMKTIQN